MFFCATLTDRAWFLKSLFTNSADADMVIIVNSVSSRVFFIVFFVGFERKSNVKICVLPVPKC